jgi:hypothetical protein
MYIQGVGIYVNEQCSSIQSLNFYNIQLPVLGTLRGRVVSPGPDCLPPSGSLCAVLLAPVGSLSMGLDPGSRQFLGSWSDTSPV